MLDKINILKIIRDHVYTLKDYGTGKYRIRDFVLFFCVPLFLSLILIFSDILLTQNIILQFLVPISLSSLFLSNILLLVYNVFKKSEDKNALKIKLIRETYSNISFCILVSVLTIIFLILTSIVDNRSGMLLIGRVLNFISYYLIILFLLTLFMVLKRIHVLLYNEFK